MFGDIRLPDKFWSKAVVTDDGCWEWQASKTAGYGAFRHEGKTVRTHRLCYIALVGSIPDGLQLDHLCRNRGCCNPEHLEPVVQRVNVLRGEGLAAQYAKRTHCPSGHELTPDNIYESQLPSRICKTCYRDAARANYAKRKLISV